jgi:hypothetical protein
MHDFGTGSYVNVLLLLAVIVPELKPKPHYMADNKPADQQKPQPYIASCYHRAAEAMRRGCMRVVAVTVLLAVLITDTVSALLFVT